MDGLIKNLEIENFRGIRSLKMMDCGRFNLLVGMNNCGKTSVLEAIECLEHASFPMKAVEMNNVRGLLDGDFSFSSLFYQQNTEIPVQLCSVLENKKKHTLKINLEVSEVQEWETRENIGERSAFALCSTLKNVYTIQAPDGAQIQELDAYAYMGKNEYGRVRYRGTSPRISPLTNYISPREVNCRELLMPQLFTEKREKELFELLRDADSRVVDVVYQPGKGSLLVDIGEEKRFPVELMGDGFRRLLTIGSALLISQNGRLLIDEIDNGLHVSTLKSLMCRILRFAVKYNVQVFAVTHNWDVIKALQNCAESEGMQDEIRAFTIVNYQDKGHKTYCYQYDELEHAIEQEIDIR